jgi:hypothetical protein
MPHLNFTTHQKRPTCFYGLTNACIDNDAAAVDFTMLFTIQCIHWTGLKILQIFAPIGSRHQLLSNQALLTVNIKGATDVVNSQESKRGGNGAGLGKKVFCFFLESLVRGI